MYIFKTMYKYMVKYFFYCSFTKSKHEEIEHLSGTFFSSKLQQIYACGRMVCVRIESNINYCVYVHIDVF